MRIVRTFKPFPEPILLQGEAEHSHARLARALQNRLTPLTSLTSHISTKTFPRRRPPHLPTTTHGSRMTLNPRPHHRDTTHMG